MSTPHTSTAITESLWDYACRLYAQPQMADTCVDLQDKHAINVCVLLAMCWLDARALSLSETQCAALETTVDEWMRHVVVPLRDLRRLLKNFEVDVAIRSAKENVRNLVKQAELTAEQACLSMIEQALAEFSLASSSAQTHNREIYLRKFALSTTELNYFLQLAC